MNREIIEKILLKEGDIKNISFPIDSSEINTIVSDFIEVWNHLRWGVKYESPARP